MPKTRKKKRAANDNIGAATQSVETKILGDVSDVYHGAGGTFPHNTNPRRRCRHAPLRAPIENAPACLFFFLVAVQRVCGLT